MRNFVLFSLTVILVSFSMCTAQQTQQDVKPTPQAPVQTITESKPAEQKPGTEGKTIIVITTEAAPKDAPAVTSPKETVTQQSQPTQGVPAVTQSSIVPVQPETKPEEKPATDNKVPSDKPNETVTQKTPEQVVPTKETMTNETKPTGKTDKPMNDTKTYDKGKSDVVTPKNEMAKSTEAPEPVLATRAFDGASFVGGIVLTLGLLAISFVGFKYYKNLTKENYHIL